MSKRRSRKKTFLCYLQKKSLIFVFSKVLTRISPLHISICDFVKSSSLRTWNWVRFYLTHDALNHPCHTRVSNSLPLFSQRKIGINFERKIFTQNVNTYGSLASWEYWAAGLTCTVSWGCIDKLWESHLEKLQTKLLFRCIRRLCECFKMSYNFNVKFFKFIWRWQEQHQQSVLRAV